MALGATINSDNGRERHLDEAAARQKSAAVLVCQDDCKIAGSAVASLRDATIRIAQQRDRTLAGTRNTNPHKSNRPAKLGRLPPSSCIGNASAFTGRVNGQFPAPPHSRYNPNDLTSTERRSRPGLLPIARHPATQTRMVCSNRHFHSPGILSADSECGSV